MANLGAARRAAEEFGVEIKTIKKTSAEYAAEKDPPPCPSVMVNGKFIARNDIVAYEAMKDAIMSDSGRKEG